MDNPPATTKGTEVVEAVPMVEVEHNVTLRANGEMELMATGTHGMAVCMDNLVEWTNVRLAELNKEVSDLEGELAICVRNKWRTEGYKRALNRVSKRVTYYVKFKALLEAGFTPVPNFPGVQVFAMRTDREFPLRRTAVVRWGTPDMDQESGKLPAGKGKYVAPGPRCTTQKIKDDDDGSERIKWTTQEWDQVEFPFAMGRPIIMEATSRAMALKTFDEIGILPATQGAATRRGDPLLVGRIIDPRSTSYNKKFVTFIIGWGLDTATL